MASSRSLLPKLEALIPLCSVCGAEEQRLRAAALQYHGQAWVEDTRASVWPRGFGCRLDIFEYTVPRKPGRG